MSEIMKEEEHGAFTSMIDIVFLLLIFFILQPFKEVDKKLPVPLKEGSSKQPVAPIEPVRVGVRGRGNEIFYTVDSRNFGSNPAGLAQVIHDRALGDLDRIPVQIESDPEVHFAHVLRAFDEACKSGAEKVGFAALPKR